MHAAMPLFYNHVAVQGYWLLEGPGPLKFPALFQRPG